MNNLLYLFIAVNVIFSMQGFKNRAFMDKYIFHEGKILYGKEYIRLITSGFLHANWGHLLFNMMTLFFFGNTMLIFLGPLQFTILYIASLIGGNLLSLYLKKDNAHYQALGASGAVSGVLYAFILPFPMEKIYLFFIPIGIPAWIFGILFIAVSIFGMSRNADNIGHEAHLGGAITGLITFLVFNPEYFLQEWKIILAMVIPTIIFLFILVKRPELISKKSNKDWGRWD